VITNLLHCPAEQQPTIIVLLISGFIIVEYCSVLINNIKQMYPVASHHAFQVIINIPLVQIFKNPRKPSFPASQELEIIPALEDEDEHAQIISRKLTA